MEVAENCCKRLHVIWFFFKKKNLGTTRLGFLDPSPILFFI
jgi:hypothetical protein